MKLSTSTKLKIFSGTASEYFAEGIAKSIGLSVGKSTLQRFSDGEIQPYFEESVRGDNVFIVQSTFSPAENIMELLLMIDAAKRASAYKVIAVIPYYGYARQDRKDKPRVAIGAKMVANLLQAAGVDRIMTMDLHAPQIQGFIDVPVDHLYASSMIVPYIRNLNLPDLLIASPDMGGSKRANVYAKFLDAEMAICHKSRLKANVVSDMKVIGEVEGKNVVIVDDMIDTAGTIVKAAEMLKEKGAKTVRAVATHPVLSGQAHERIENSALEEVIFTDSIPLRKKNSKIKILSAAELFGNAILNVHQSRSISKGFLE
ncbi:ribose-phosphate pyrophosphokinase [Balneicella halophila]|uniref:ribose-phosphate diphosphokinase n=1 Tax=Balneicella halophila TaxID=1537566 RepID=A0A7L4UR48_BALHA|nr:ribose-phosphate pyrophosphokinase [Balneicella halophila]PVX52248.1 ribose-phosphate pyrophosphokinase [Balneicella halophila]